jgi:hypothetical protein
LQKSPYIINGSVVEQIDDIDDEEFKPVQFIESIKSFQSGQVYSVLVKDFMGNFHKLSRNTDKASTFAEKVSKELNEEERIGNEQGKKSEN